MVDTRLNQAGFGKLLSFVLLKVERGHPAWRLGGCRRHAPASFSLAELFSAAIKRQGPEAWWEKKDGTIEAVGPASTLCF